MYIEENLSEWLANSKTVLVRGATPKDAMQTLLQYVDSNIIFGTDEPELRCLCEYLKLNMSNYDCSIQLMTGDTYELKERMKALNKLWYFQVLADKQKPNPRGITYFDTTIDFLDGQIRGVAHK